jgi:hypothetical protein
MKRVGVGLLAGVFFLWVPGVAWAQLEDIEPNLNWVFLLSIVVALGLIAFLGFVALYYMLAVVARNRRFAEPVATDSRSTAPAATPAPGQTPAPVTFPDGFVARAQPCVGEPGRECGLVAQHERDLDRVARPVDARCQGAEQLLGAASGERLDEPQDPDRDAHRPGLGWWRSAARPRFSHPRRDRPRLRR